MPSKKPTDLHEKALKGEGILPQPESPSVADNLTDAAAGHAPDEEPRSPFETDDEMYQASDGEEEQKTHIGGQ